MSSKRSFFIAKIVIPTPLLHLWYGTNPHGQSEISLHLRGSSKASRRKIMMELVSSSFCLRIALDSQRVDEKVALKKPRPEYLKLFFWGEEVRRKFREISDINDFIHRILACITPSSICYVGRGLLKFGCMPCHKRSCTHFNQLNCEENHDNITFKAIKQHF